MPSGPVPLFSSSGPMSAPPAMNDALSVYTPPPVSAGESSADFEEMTSGGRMGRALGSPAGLALVLGGLAIVALGVFGVVLLTDGDDDAKASATATNDAASKATTEADRKAEAKPDAKDDGAKKADAKTDAEKPGDAGSSDAKPEDADAKADDAKAGDAKADDPKPEAAAAPGPTPAPERDADAPARPRWAAAADPGDALPARTFAPEDDPPEVTAALRSREVRALDVFLVAPERKGTLTFDQAVAYCQALEIAGLTGWRVPTIGELNSVANAKMLSKAIFWSATPGDSFGDLRLVVGTKKATTIVAVPKTWDGAKIACIRPRQP